MTCARASPAASRGLGLTDVAALCADWRPDLVVCDEIDFGSMIAAERLGLPYASVLVIAAGSFVRRELVGEALNTRLVRGRRRDQRKSS